jgi:hypothetical protein
MAVGILLLTGVTYAQEPDVPMTWKGEGEATFISSDGEREIEFDLEFHVDSEGYVTGETSTDEGGTDLERLYYGDPVDAEYPALDSRKLILVLSIESDTPILIIMNGQVLNDKYFYGELRLARQNADGMEDALDIGNKMATSIYADSLPSGLKMALKNSAPMGYFEVIGKKVTDK